MRSIVWDLWLEPSLSPAANTTRSPPAPPSPPGALRSALAALYQDLGLPPGGTAAQLGGEGGGRDDSWGSSQQVAGRKGSPQIR